MEKNKKSLKVCFIIAGFSAGGAQKQCILLINELQKDPDIEIYLFCFYKGIHFHLLNTDNINLQIVPTRSFYDISNIIKLFNKIKNINPTIIISWLHASDVYSSFIKFFMRNVKWIMTERDSFYPFDIRYLLRGFVGKSADLIVANSLRGREYWVNKGVPIKQVKVINNILNLPSPTSVRRLDGNPVVVYAGRLEIQKNVLVIAEAFCYLGKKFPQGVFYIIGEGSLEGAINSLISKHNKGDQVKVLSFKENIQDFFCSASLFVNISHHEGTPNTVLENIYLNVPVLLSNIEEHKAIVGDTYPYLLDDYRSVESVVDMMVEMLENKNSDIYLDIAKKYILSLSPEIVVSQYKEIFISMK